MSSGSPTTYTYDASHKHAVASLSTGETYSYDANGNMITRVEGGLTYTQTFDAENRLISVTVSGQTTQFIYDGDGNLVKKVNPDNSKTIYMLGIYEVDKTSGGTVTQTRTYYPAAGAMRIGSTLYYVLKDHLGSASVITNASGVTVSGGEQRYYPFGESRLAATMLTDKLFTGQREMAGLGIYHYQARFYSPKLGRFLSADTIIPEFANPQSWNRFSYAVNNPIKYNDPSGHCFYAGIDTIACIVIVVIIVTLIADSIDKGVQNQGDVPMQPFPTKRPLGLVLVTSTPTRFPTAVRPSPTNCPQALIVCLPTPTSTQVYGPLLASTSSPTNTGTSTSSPTGATTNTSTPTSTSTNTSTPNSGSTPPPPIFTPAPPRPGGPAIAI